MNVCEINKKNRQLSDSERKWNAMNFNLCDYVKHILHDHDTENERRIHNFIFTYENHRQSNDRKTVSFPVDNFDNIRSPQSKPQLPKQHQLRRLIYFRNWFEH